MKQRKKLTALLVMLSMIMQTGTFAAPAFARGETNRRVLFQEAFLGEEGDDLLTNPANLEGNDYFSTGFVKYGTTEQWPANRFAIEKHEIDGEQVNMLRKIHNAGTQQRPTRNFQEGNKIPMNQDGVYYISYQFRIGQDDDFAPMTNGSPSEFDALMIDLNARAGGGVTKNNEGKIVPFVSFHSGSEHIAYGTKEIEKEVLYDAVLKIEAHETGADVMSFAAYPHDEEFSGTYDVTHSFSTNTTYNKITYHFKGTGSKDNQSTMILGNVLGEKEDHSIPDPTPEPPGEDEIILFQEPFFGEANADLVADPRNQAGNDYFSTGFLKNATDPWPEGRFVVEPHEVSGTPVNMLRKTFNAGTQQRPVRYLKSECGIPMNQDGVYYISYNFQIGQYDDFAPMTDGTPTEFDALMIDLNTRAGGGVAKNSEGKLVPFVSFHTGSEHIAYGSKEIEKEVLYHAVLKIEAKESGADVMSLAVYPEGEAFSGEYDVSHSFSTNTTYNKVLYHFKATGSGAEAGVPELVNRSTMFLGNVVARREADAPPEETTAPPEETTAPPAETTPPPTEEPGNPTIAPIDIPRPALAGSTIAFEDFRYDGDLYADRIPELNQADGAKGFASGWVSGGTGNVSTGVPMSDAKTDGRGNLIFPGANNKVNMRKLSQPVDLESGGIYYVTWTQKGDLPRYDGNHSQKLELGTSDGAAAAIMVGLIRQAGSTRFKPFIKMNNESIQYATKTLDPTKEYILVARIETSTAKDKVSLRAYERGTYPIEEWDVSLNTVSLAAKSADRVDFNCNFAYGDGIVRYGNVVIDRYTAGTLAATEPATKLVSGAMDSLSETDYEAACRAVSELENGIIKSENMMRLQYIKAVIDNEKIFISNTEKLVEQLEAAAFTKENYKEIKATFLQLETNLEAIRDKEKKAVLQTRAAVIKQKLEELEIWANVFTEGFDTPEGTPLSQNQWKADAALKTELDDSIAGGGGKLAVSGNLGVYHTVKDQGNDTLYAALKIAENAKSGFLGMEFGGYQLGIADQKLVIKQGGTVLAQQPVSDTKGSLFLCADREELTVYLKNDSLAILSVPQKVQGDSIGIIGENAQAMVEEISVSGAVERLTDGLIQSAKSLEKKNQYPVIMELKGYAGQLQECPIKAMYRELEEYYLEQNKKLVPQITSLSASGSARPGKILKAVYVLNDLGGNAGDAEISWNGRQGTDIFPIPSGFSGSRITLSVIPVNLFGEKGEERSVTVSVTGLQSGGGGGGGGANIANNPDKEVPQPNNNIPESAPKDFAFLDIESHWAREEINALAQKGIVNGIEKEFFYPDAEITRAQFAKIIASIINEAEGPISFADVPAGAWYHQAVAKVCAAGIMQGGGNEFEPERSITREEIAVTILRLFAYMGGTSEKKEIEMFTDEDRISSWAKDSVETCAAMKLMQGLDGGAFEPQSNATRAEASAVIYRVIQSVA